MLQRLRLQCIERGLCPPDVSVKLGLVYGHATKMNAVLLEAKFEKAGWLLYSAEWLFDRVRRLADGGYENSTAAVVAKLLLRPPSTSDSPLDCEPDRPLKMELLALPT